jgi:hypothetical protein
VTGVLLAVGEVRTALLMNSVPLAPTGAEALLDLVAGSRVRSAERPLARAVSADLVHAVDCALRTGSGAKVRGIGTLLARANVTGGRVVQASARGAVVAGGTRRLGWAHYLERLGTVEAVGRAVPDDLARGFPGDQAPGATLDPGAACGQLLAGVQGSPLLDHRPAFRARRTRLRWSAVVAPGRAAGVFTVRDATERTLELRLPAEVFPDDTAALAGLCEDLARHDWLLSVVGDVAERACRGRADPASLRRLRPAVDHLLHLWMPGLDVPAELLSVWRDLEAAPGFSRQWQSCVDRIRDHMALSALELLARDADTAPIAAAVGQRAADRHRAGVPLVPGLRPPHSVNGSTPARPC